MLPCDDYTPFADPDFEIDRMIEEGRVDYRRAWNAYIEHAEEGDGFAW